MKVERQREAERVHAFTAVVRLTGVAVAVAVVVGCSSLEARGERGDATFPCRAEPVVATGLGSVPDSGTAEIENVELPNGAAVAPEEAMQATEDGAPSAPVLWISDDPVDAAVRDELVDRFAETGLWPVWLQGLEGQAERPWDVGEFTGGDADRIDAIDAQQWLREEVDATQFDEFPKPAPEADPIVHDCGAASIEVSGVPINGRLGLIPAARGADAITTVGWLGPINYIDDVAAYSSVLRSWEDRFGAQVVSIGFDTLTVVLTRPPSRPAALEQLANEVWLVCPDVVDQGVGSPQALAEELSSNPMIDCWWD